MACAASDAHSATHKIDHGLSAEYLLFHGVQNMPGKDPASGLSFDAANLALKSAGQPHEQEWPYQQVQPDPWLPPKVTQAWYGALQDPGTQFERIVEILKTGNAVVLGLRVVSGFRRAQSPPHVIDDAGTPGGRHAVVAVGTGQRSPSATEDLVLIRNSWGGAWGSDGHAWLSAEYLRKHLVECRTLIPVKNS